MDKTIICSESYIIVSENEKLTLEKTTSLGVKLFLEVENCTMLLRIVKLLLIATFLLCSSDYYFYFYGKKKLAKLFNGFSVFFSAILLVRVIFGYILIKSCSEKIWSSFNNYIFLLFLIYGLVLTIFLFMMMSILYTQIDINLCFLLMLLDVYFFPNIYNRLFSKILKSQIIENNQVLAAFCLILLCYICFQLYVMLFVPTFFYVCFGFSVIIQNLNSTFMIFVL
jgi:hypothetical protein